MVGKITLAIHKIKSEENITDEKTDRQKAEENIKTDKLSSKKSDLEIDNERVIESDTDAPQEMGDENVEVRLIDDLLSVCCKECEGLIFCDDFMT